MRDRPWLSLRHGLSVSIFARGVRSAHAGVASFGQSGTNHLSHLVCRTELCLPPSLSRRRKPGRSAPGELSRHSPSCTSSCRGTCAQVHRGLTVASSASPLRTMLMRLLFRRCLLASVALAAQNQRRLRLRFIGLAMRITVGSRSIREYQ
jgi:hypothetical protein